MQDRLENSGEVDDFKIASPPTSELEELILYFEKQYPEKRSAIVKQIEECKKFKDKHTVTLLGYNSLSFKIELDQWLCLAEQVLNEEIGDKINIAHDERSDEKRKVNQSVIKAQAENMVAPLKRAYHELKSMQDTLNKTILFTQTQVRATSQEEYGEIFSQDNSVPDPIYNAPSVSVPLKRIRK